VISQKKFNSSFVRATRSTESVVSPTTRCWNSVNAGPILVEKGHLFVSMYTSKAAQFTVIERYKNVRRTNCLVEIIVGCCVM